MGFKREGRPAAFAGRSESVFGLHAAGIPVVPIRESILSHLDAPHGLPLGSHAAKQSEKLTGKTTGAFGGKDRDPLHVGKQRAEMANTIDWSLPGRSGQAPYIPDV